MTALLECRGCDRHVRVDAPKCPFCGLVSSITATAPRRRFGLVGYLPLLVACSSEADPASKPDAKAPTPAAAEAPPAKPTTAVKPEAAPPRPPDAEPEAVTDDGVDQPSAPPDLGTRIEPPPKPEVDRPMATKYGGPPRPARKYGGPPRPGPDDPPEGL